jgi:hypothetical protein
MFYGTGTMNELVKEIDEYKTDVCSLQEIKWPGKGIVDIKMTNMILEHDCILVEK